MKGKILIFMNLKIKINKVEIENMTLSFQELELANKKLNIEKNKVNQQKNTKSKFLINLHNLEL